MSDSMPISWQNKKLGSCTIFPFFVTNKNKSPDFSHLSHIIPTIYYFQNYDTRKLPSPQAISKFYHTHFTSSQLCRNLLHLQLRTFVLPSCASIFVSKHCLKLHFRSVFRMFSSLSAAQLSKSIIFQRVNAPAEPPTTLAGVGRPAGSGACSTRTNTIPGAHSISNPHLTSKTYSFFGYLRRDQRTTDQRNLLFPDW